jgi:hypothetical protein
LAQYPSNGNQKITLGEQTTADGLVYRGVAATDTVRKPSIDTMAYMVLDTTTNIMWHYKKATSNAWLRLNLLPSDTASMLTPYWRAGRFSGVLPLLNGGTGSATQNFVDLTTTQTVGGAKTFSSTVTGARFDPTSSSASGNGMFLPTSTSIGYSVGGVEQLRVIENGTVLFGNTNTPNATAAAVRGIHIENATQAATMQMIGLRNNEDGGFLGLWKARGEDFNVTNVSSKYALNGDYPGKITFGGYKFGGWRIGAEINVRYDSVASGNLPSTILFRTGLVSMSDRMHIRHDGKVWIGYTTDQGGSLLQVNGSINAAGTTYTSDERYKENIIPLNKGLDIINKLKPVTFNYINTTENNFSEFEEIGFIAQDVDRALSTETFVKSIVKYSDESNTDSKMVFSPQNLIPILTKAIQEQQALIKALEQRIINLENK